MAAIATAVAGTAAAAAYLNAKFHIQHDLTAGSLVNTAAAAQTFIAEKQAQGKLLLYHKLEDHARERPDRPFLEYEDRAWTYGEFFACLQRVGNWLMNDLGVREGEIVALDGPNSAEYLMLWFALEGIGAGVAYVNSHLTGASLVSSVKLCEARYLIAERGIEDLVAPHVDELRGAGVTTFWYDAAFIDSLTDTTPIPPERGARTQATDVRKVSFVLIYTSGTTGLPKGVMQMVGRTLNTARNIAEYLKLTPDDKFYTCLPLYHGAGQGLCTTPVIYVGASMRLGRRFSHKTFWPEVHASKANRLQYVGELCRYLVNAPPHPLERRHHLAEAWGNGMRPDVWERFRQRFNIPVIHELYAATDGMGATFNYNRGEFTRNAIALRGLIWHARNGGTEVRAKIDPDTEDIVRGKDGWVLKAGINEAGEVLHKIDPSVKTTAFRGYFKNPAASEKRWMQGVFEPGDLWFRSGDVMRLDADGRVFFVDRAGDTFRWKSENVSTNEVADVVGSFAQIAETNVYGVAVPHADGRCGCAMLVLQPSTSPESLDLRGLARHVLERLPRYAVPIFLRVTPQIAVTGTYKMQKGPAKREGVDLDVLEKAGSQDRMFWLPNDGNSYVPFRRQDWEALKAGRIKI
ncbi:hypothetical protein BDY17DRAFT_333062 [Neohortaea acidophila]|uniref:AMP-dependent synthetase/ligase domain-containing protein n=1 Tax=Neohortaea acidophila TaxID=245834 RepID=A0A6A6Q1C3_9PEZI|nr:uncharacterized protein BDY17DRAFT_333062 [Neohortaea acidophila]KAF2485794.1 hypothetical protein BDY17DRAFT_333062 [Neohortaea acidophila]